MMHIVTDGLLQDHLNCESKSYLRLHGRTGQVTDYAALCSRLDSRLPYKRVAVAGGSIDDWRRQSIWRIAF